MGGRGAVSVSGMEHAADGGLTNIGGAPDRRSDIQKSFVDELGFKEVTGTNKIPTATLNSYAIALKDLEREYGAIAASDNPIFTTGNSYGGTRAAVYYDPANPADQFMVISTNHLGSTSRNLEGYRRSEQSGWHPASDGRITNQNAFTVAHEYGHMLHNALISKNGISLKTATNEIKAIAEKKYNGSGGVSRYGAKNEQEFFAESFASAHSGNPNAYGKAMLDWLKDNKIKR